jgi:HEAT repeat protein
VLREGPVELHSAAATSLSYIGDPASVGPLIEHLRTDRGPSRHHVVRALAATLRTKPDQAARKMLRELSNDNSVKVSLAAIYGLAAARDPNDAAFLRDLVERGASDRRRAAAWALGEMQDVGSINVLATALSAGKDDRLVGDSAWALGEIAAAHPKDPKIAPLVDRWLYLAKHGGWAASADSTAALARLLWALPHTERNTLLGGGRRKTLLALAYHRSRLVRMNLAHALGTLTSDDDAAKALATMLREDSSVHVRVSAARNLARVGGARVAPALKTAADTEADPLVKAAAKAAQAGPPPPPAARTEWRVFQVVDPGAEDAPVRQTPYFIHTPDGLVTATYTDARGELASEHIPADTAGNTTAVWPASRESEY